jgi:phosphoglycerate dehydrogenase-like enzyme
LKIGFLSKVDIHIKQVTSVFAPEPVQICRTKEELAEAIGDLEVLIAMNQGYERFTIDAGILAKAKNLRLIQHHGVATDITDIDEAAARGIPVATVPGQNCRSVACGLLAAGARAPGPHGAAVAERRRHGRGDVL